MKKITSAIVQYIKDIDKVLLLLCMGCSTFGIVVLMGVVNTFINHPSKSVSSRTVLVQVAATSLGLIAALIIAKIDYRFMAKMWKLHAPICYLLVVLTFFFGVQRPGADDRAWFLLPGGIMFQPAEVLKFSFILSFALHLEKVKNNINSLLNVLLLCLHGAAPILLIHFQGDDGTALIFALIFAVMMFTAGISFKYIIAAIGAVLVAAPVAWFFVMNYDQKHRIKVLFNPELDPLGIGYQQMQGRIALGSGQIWGNGLFTGKHKYVPEIHNDFIFTFIGNALGLVGCLCVIALLCAVCIRILKTAHLSRDLLGTYICAGVFAMIAFQTVMNIGMCLSVLPVIGLTLPFFSAGGSSVTTLYLSVGLVLSVSMHNKPLFFE